MIKTAWYRHKIGRVQQQNITEDLEINPYNYGRLTFDKGAKNLHLKKDSLSTDIVYKTVYSHKE